MNSRGHHEFCFRIRPLSDQQHEKSKLHCNFITSGWRTCSDPGLVRQMMPLILLYLTEVSSRQILSTEDLNSGWNCS